MKEKIEDIYSLTSLQEGMLYHSIKEKGNQNYLIQAMYEISGKIEEEKINESLQMLSKKYGTLRTAFVIPKSTGIARQVVFQKKELEFKVEEGCEEKEIEEILRKDLERGFDLQKDSLVRLKLIKGEGKSRLLWTMHHIILDGWCLSLLFNDFVKYYNKLLRGESVSEVEHQADEERRSIPDYGTYVRWIERQGEQKNGQLYWKELLKDYESTAEIRPYYEEQNTVSQVGNEVILCSREQTEKLVRISQKIHVTINTLLEAAWGIVLQRNNRTDDVVYGKVVSGRNVPIEGIEKTVGLFINTIPIRVKSNEQTSCEELAVQLLKQSNESNRYDHCSLAEIQNNTSQGSKLIKTIFVYENYYVDDSIGSEKNEIDLSLEYFREQTNYDISVVTEMENGVLKLGIMYPPKKYRKEEIVHILEQYRKVLEAFSENIKQKVSEISVITEEEKDKILNDFNNTEKDMPEGKTAADLFEEQVRRNPEAIAVKCNEKTITYEELDKRSGKLASRLRKMGIQPDEYVAIFAKRSIEMIVGMLGVIKAGGAYIPIDPESPPDRFNFIIQDSRPKCILKAYSEIPVETSIPVIDLEKGIEDEEIQDFKYVHNAENAAYVIYTSGTTGNPKGVVIEHRNLYNFVLSMRSKTGMNRPERLKFAWLSPYYFDMSVKCLYGALTSGNQLVIVTEEERMDEHKLAECIRENKIDYLDGTPTHMNLIATSEEVIDNDIRIIVGGEKLTKSTYQNLKRIFPNCHVYNTYGPTEATVDATLYDVEEAGVKREVIPIGKPLDNVKVYIMNGKHLCGIGMAGEICIAGTGIARGYLNRPELTEEKFVKNPFGEGRMYRSGDLARWLPDGNIEYLERMDEQVKIRGFRIELGEIESRLRETEDIGDCAVIARTDSAGDKAIYAYYTSDRKISPADIREELSRKLPVYMVPSYIMQVEIIPLTSNGKLNKKALPEIETRTTIEYIPPRNETEEKICEIYSGILNVERVGIKDNFFELGGHSLRATRLVNRIEAETGSKIDLKYVFSHPTPEQLAVIAAGGSDEYIPIPKAEEKEYYPMSSPQKRTYLIQQMQPEAITYNTPTNIRLYGEVDAEALRTAFQKMIDRHEILRTAFVLEEYEPVQKIQPDAEAEFEYINSEEDDAALINGYMKAFDLSKPPLVRMKLVKKRSYYLLMIDMHHIISDGMSAEIFIRELSALYNGKKLKPLTHQYKDYSEWMRTRDISQQKEYWIKQFEDEIPVLEMPTDFVRPQKQSNRGDIIIRNYGKESSRKIKKFASENKVTDYMVFLAAAMITVSKYSRQEDIVIGSPVSGRTHIDTEDMLGMFVNTLAMRGKPEKNKRFCEFLNEVKESCFKAYENQEYPFEELIEEINVSREISRNPVFDVLLAMENNEEARISLKGVEEEPAEFNDKAAKFDLSFIIMYSDDEYRFMLEYCTDLYRKESADNILKHFISILEQVMKTPEIKLGRIETVTDDERRLILNEFNATDKEYPRNRTVIELFEEQVRKTPDNTAVVFEDTVLTYAQLNAKADQLAEKLRRSGIRRGDFVAVIPERSAEVIIGVCGILKTGAAYVPIDPSYPEQRKKEILNDCKAGAVLVYGVRLDTELPVIDLSESESWKEEGINTEVNCKAEDVAYCIYTSGTTGKPKGVMIRNRSILRLVMNCDYAELNEKTVILQTGQLAFDASTFEIWGTLLHGGSLHMIREELLLNSRRFKEYLEDHKINTLFITTALFNQYVNDDVSIFDSLDSLMFGGERTAEEQVRKLKKHNKALKLSNVYGPTETTTFATHYVIEDNGTEKTPIGKPISNTKAYVLDENQLCGIGVPGELCIAGDGVAKGYLNRPELTAEKFVKNPFGEGEMYRSGDLARWLPDGNIEFLGRIDEQVKIRGFRIELGEIEKHINSIENIRDCVVVAKTDAAGDMAIYAYFTADVEVEIQKIREKLKETLPDYMIPSYMMQIECIPVTRNGKVDKPKLPPINSKLANQFVLPVSELEKYVAEAFEKVLKCGRVGRTDNFFELGGHSLKSVQLVNMLDGKVTAKDIFDFKTVAEIAKCIEKNTATKSVVQRIKPTKFTSVLEMSAAQRRLYAFSKLDETGISYNIPYCFKLSGEFNEKKANNAFSELVKRHESLRTSFKLDNGVFKQFINAGEKFEIKHIALIDNSVEKTFINFIKPFDLEEALKFRAALTRNEAGEQFLMIDFHHIAVDGYSISILFEEFEKLYNGKSLKDAELQYRDYCVWFDNRDISQQKKYWMDVFRKPVSNEELPLDYRRIENNDHTGFMFTEYLGKTDKELLIKFCDKHNITPYAFFIAVLSILLSRYYCSDDVVIGTSVSCRTHIDTENIVGMLVNTIAVRTNVNGEVLVSDYMNEVERTVLMAVNNQEYPFDELVNELNAQRRSGRNPLFDVFINYYDLEIKIISGDGFKAELINDEIGSGKFDLVFNIIPEKFGYKLIINYRSALFAERTVRQMCRHFKNLVKWCTLNPQEFVREAQMLSESDRIELLNTFQTEKEYDSSITFIDMLKKCTENYGSKNAIVYNGTNMTYSELSDRTDKIASMLIKKGVSSGSVVGVAAYADFSMFLGAIGVMKAGAGYMPIDPNYPEKRIAYMLEKSASNYILCTKKLAYRFEDISELLYIEDSVEENVSELPKVSASDLAYVIFTSGSTGKPKGVEIEHGSLANLIFWNNNYYGIRSSDKTIKYASFGFDASIHEMYPQLAAGAEIHIIPDNMRMDFNSICNYIDQNEINIGFFPTPVCEQIMKQKSRSLKKLITGGDKLKSYSSDYEIYNNYGPTEGTVLSTVFYVDKEYDNIPIGKPIDNVKVYIVDKDNRLQPIGVAGEILLSGKGLARGYINDYELTALKFVDNVIENNGTRMYHTGDIGRWLPDGNIEYLGRNDEQVKIRGNRIELSEIASVLVSKCGIRDCVVDVDSSVQSERIIVYYISEEPVDETKIKEKLSMYIPSYMIPDTWVWMKEFPMTTNGKVDKKKLIPPALKTKSVIDPRTKYEKLISGIWKDTLHSEKISVTDNFFEAGGTSLTLAMMFTELSKCFTGRLNIADVFANPSIEKLARYIESIDSAKSKHIISGIEFNEGLNGESQPAEYKFNINRNEVRADEKQITAAVIYTLSRIAAGETVVVHRRSHDATYSTLECNMHGINTLNQIAGSVTVSEKGWRCEDSQRRFGKNENICGLYIHETAGKALTRTERRDIEKQFDLWFDIGISRNEIAIVFSQISAKICDGAAEKILKALISVIEMINDQ